MGIKVRQARERWVRGNGITEMVKLEKPCGAMLVDYRGQRKFLKVDGGKEKAIEKAREIENGLIRDEWNGSEGDPGAELFREYAGRRLARKKRTRKHSTCLSYNSTLKHHILPVFGERSLREITPAEGRRIISDGMGEGYDRGTVRTILSIALDTPSAPIYTRWGLPLRRCGISWATPTSRRRIATPTRSPMRGRSLGGCIRIGRAASQRKQISG